jgi:ubiquinone/menaquinone biosynthesis C-methylase UbiE
MALSSYEPPVLEVRLTLALGLTVLSPYYRGFVKSLNLRGDERVLDFGSGSGICSRHTAAHLRHGGHLACVDVSRGWMDVIRRILRRYDNVSYHPGRITQLDLPESTFDLVVIHFVLHDIPAAERPAVTIALARKLKPGGRLVLREPQGEGLTPEEINQLMGSAGLHPSSTAAHKIAIGAVYDACFIR